MAALEDSSFGRLIGVLVSPGQDLPLHRRAADLVGARCWSSCWSSPRGRPPGPPRTDYE